MLLPPRGAGGKAPEYRMCQVQEMKEMKLGDEVYVPLLDRLETTLSRMVWGPGSLSRIRREDGVWEHGTSRWPVTVSSHHLKANSCDVTTASFSDGCLWSVGGTTLPAGGGIPLVTTQQPFELTRQQMLQTSSKADSVSAKCVKGQQASERSCRSPSQTLFVVDSR
ncbi:unnamed protein product [Rangifer tarandus platyrhynchus]|uniref:Uncharacterized protein n=2 Tax=Rangifer tarandus platyrhynchus TaxID=3082113 RepID=A0ABN9A0F9_RANTA|nr:unnamed protein product [Rangifer tarandus platyrhynchus]CAI9711996.1 unnamed protein product [Rangifer tarandus platyrhynchus]